MKQSQLHITHNVIQEVLTNSRKLKSFHKFFSDKSRIKEDISSRKKVEKFTSK